MAQNLSAIERRTSADDVFEHLQAQINALKLLPGTRISEVDVARQFDVSRQPVREAFIRLSNLGLLLIRPQKATIVRRFSHAQILRARFVRYAVECEVLRRACAKPLGRHEEKLRRSLESQLKVVEDGDIDQFHTLDYEFHRMLCAAADSSFVFDTITENKIQVDRLCLLSLSQPTAMADLYQDHVQIVEGLIAGDEAKVLEVIHVHLSRLDEVVTSIRKSHGDFFED